MLVHVVCIHFYANIIYNGKCCALLSCSMLDLLTRLYLPLNRAVIPALFPTPWRTLQSLLLCTNMVDNLLCRYARYPFRHLADR